MLTVQCDSTAWATQVRLLAPQLVARLNKDLGQGTVKRSRCSVRTCLRAVSAPFAPPAAGVPETPTGDRPGTFGALARTVAGG